MEKDLAASSLGRFKSRQLETVCLVLITDLKFERLDLGIGEVLLGIHGWLNPRSEPWSRPLRGGVLTQ